MNHTLVLNLPGEIYEPLLATARRLEKTPEDLVLEWLKNIFQQTEATDDPLEKFIGAWKSGIPNWSHRHDEYLGEEYLSHHRDKH